MKRREFLRAAVAGGALYSVGGLPVFSRTASASGFAAVQDPVLVNVMLAGGPDFRHLMPPAFDTNPFSYGYRYWEARAAAHGIADSVSAFEDRWRNDYFHVGNDSTEFGILKSCGWLNRMWGAGNVAIVPNVFGADSRNHAHCQLVLDQGDLTSGRNDGDKSGWGGRFAAAAGGNVLALTNSPRRFCYGPHPSDPSRHSNANLLALRNTREFTLYDPAAERSPTDPRSRISRSLKSYYAAKRNEMARESTYYRFFEMEKKLRELGAPIDERLLSVPLPDSIQALYKQDGLTSQSRYFGEQIRNLYDSFACNDLLSMRVASMEYTGWDSHKDQRNTIEPKFEDLFGDGKAFDVLFNELPDDALDNMTLVIAGEFGRQLRANGRGGTDHGWGSSALIIGRRVNGGVYGDLFPEDELERLDDPSPQITGRIPFDQLLSAVCDWAEPGSSDTVFPRLASLSSNPDVSLSKLFV